MVESSSSMWSPLRHPTFRGLWVAGSFFFIGNAMTNMAASWLMLIVTESPMLAALVQTAAFLPMFLLPLPAGVLADTANRRTLMLTIQGVYIAAALALTVFSIWGTVGPVSLLAFTFVLGACTALQGPSWNSTVSDAVDHNELPQAITLGAMAFNGARAAGPALAGAVFAWVGGGGVFSVAVLSACAMSYATMRWPPAVRPKPKLPPERIWGGMLSALRFARHSPEIFAQLVRTMTYSGVGSALWALLPVIAQQRLGLGPAGFGLLMGCLGTGAVLAGFFVGRIRARIGLDMLATVCSLVFAATTVAGAWSTSHAVVYTAFVFGGAAWMSIMSTFNAATQTSAPRWVRARAASLHTVSSLGAFSLGSAVWGAISSALGVETALYASALLMVCSVAMTRRFPLRMGDEAAVTMDFDQGGPLVAEEPEFEAGPVAVEIIYRIDAAHSAAFRDAVQRLAVPRRRDGATFWRLYRDLGDPTRYVERFIVKSWADYLRQRSRATLAIRELEAQARAYQRDDEPVVIRHYLAERGA